MKPSIQSDPLGLQKFSGHLQRGEYDEAVKFARDNGFAVRTALIDFDRLSVYERLESASPARADLYLRQYRKTIEAQRSARDALTDLERGGAGKLRSEKIAELVAGPAGMTAAQRVDELRKLGGDDAERAAELVRARNPIAIGAERIAKSRADEAAAKAKATRDKAIHERLEPRLRAERGSWDARYREQLNAIKAKYRDKDGVVHEQAQGYIEATRALNEGFNAGWARTHGELAAKAATEVDAAAAAPPGPAAA